MAEITPVDISRSKPKRSFIKRNWQWGIAIVVIAAACHYLYFLAQADFSVDANNITYDEVKRGEFSISVRGSGVLVPNKIEWLSANIEARVERIVVKPGKVVKKGDLIAELSNPQLVQLMEETAWELEARLAEAKASHVEQQSILLDQKAKMLNAQLNYESSKLKQQAHTELLESTTGAVSKIDYEQTRLETIQLKQRWHIQQEIFSTMKENITVQQEARTARLNKMKKELERAQQQVDNLKIYATIDSVVQAVPVEPGQHINMGGNIAKLAQQHSLIAELQVPELHIRDVTIGQKVTVDTRNNKVTGVVSRVDPAVVAGNVQVDVEFTQTLPSDARPDLAVDGEIKITEIAKTLFIDRPLFAQSESHSSLYKLSKDGQFAERVSVKLGKGSIDQIQIIEGLSIGDKVIISDPSTFDTYQKIRIN